MYYIKLIVLLLFIGAFVGLTYWVLNPMYRVPVIAVPIETHDFGRVRYGDIPSHEFKIQNTGNAELQIKKISTSCGCTTAEIDDKNVLPGESTVLTVFFNPAIHKDDTDLGKLTRVVYIDTNDPQTPETEIKIFADVYKE